MTDSTDSTSTDSTDSTSTDSTESTNILALQQGLSPGNRVELFTLDLTNAGYDEVLYFSPSSVENEEVVYDGQTYTSIPIYADGFEVSGTGSLAQPSLKIANVSNLAASLAASYDDLVGCMVTRKVTFRQFLDDGTEADPYASFPATKYEVIQKKKQNKTYIEWTLAALMDRDGDKLPKRVVWKSYCSWRYRYWDSDSEAWVYDKAQCPYTGTSYFDEDDNSVTDAADDVCSKKVSGCRARYGDTATLPFGGFPGTETS